jgi:hypothetical protein
MKDRKAYMRNWRACRHHRPFVEALTHEELEEELADILRINPAADLFPWYQEVLRRCLASDTPASFQSLPRVMALRSR